MSSSRYFPEQVAFRRRHAVAIQRYSRGDQEQGGASGSHDLPGGNRTHLSKSHSEREDVDMGRTTLRRVLVSAELSSPRRRRSS